MTIAKLMEKPNLKQPTSIYPNLPQPGNVRGDGKSQAYGKAKTEATDTNLAKLTLPDPRPAIAVPIPISKPMEMPSLKQLTPAYHNLPLTFLSPAIAAAMAVAKLVEGPSSKQPTPACPANRNRPRPGKSRGCGNNQNCRKAQPEATYP